jgi:hypothetical protein
MSKRYAVFLSLADAEAFIGAINLRRGYPKVGTRTRDGRQATVIEGTTVQHMATPIRHRSRAEFCVPYSVTEEDLAGRASQVLDTLPDDWFPARTSALPTRT